MVPNSHRFPKVWWHWWRLLVAIALVAVCIGGVVVVRIYCGIGVVRAGKECVGVTDGSYIFDPALAAVEGDIKAEDDSIGSAPSVTVAVLLPMTTTTDLLSQQQIRSNVEGSFTEQYESNHTNTLPKIRLVLANEGSQEQEWSRVVHQLEGMVQDRSSPLVAVTGLGVSVRETADVQKELSSKKIPMVGSEYTADNLGITGLAAPVGGRVPGLTRVIPTNGDEVQALGSYLASHFDLGPNGSKAMLVDDRNSDDLYPATLANDFQTALETKAAWANSGFLTAPFDAEPGSTAVSAQFQEIANRLCDKNAAQLVFYAGRGSLLPDFLNGLSGQGCQQKRLTVVTGSDATAIQNARAVKEKMILSGVTLLYAAPNDPKALENSSNPDSSQYSQFVQEFTGAGDSSTVAPHFDQGDLDSGWAVPGHDAMLTAIRAIQNTAAGTQHVRPTPPDVTGSLAQLNVKENPVHGAGGAFWFDDKTGNRVSDRPVPVLRLAPNDPAPVVTP